MKKYIYTLFILAITFHVSPSMSASSFNAICELKDQHHYHLAKNLDGKGDMINEWTTYDDRSTSISINYNGGKYLQIIDSRQTKPSKALVFFDNGNTILALYTGQGSNSGEFGATTRTYAINIKAKAILSSTLKSGSSLSPTIQASVDGKPDCIFK